tara:strand:+ start:266 stop:1336 length:1071 start_codon:yes stop_codon:yes gene_type:complete
MVPYISKAEIAERLPAIFPEGTPNRINCINDVAASVFFVMLYINAVEGSGQCLGPKHVYCMSDDQAAKPGDSDRTYYTENCYKNKFVPAGERWYADNTRESIRDDTIREGLMTVGAVGAIELPTTSSKPRYFLQLGIEALFDPALTGNALTQAIEAWQTANLTIGALARVQIVRRGAAASTQGVQIILPNGETRRMAAGPSSVITKAVVEEFAPRYLVTPAVLWVSESGNKVVSSDDGLAQTIGLQIEADKNLPDLILVDIGTANTLIVFVEVVATDGPVSERRKAALLELTDSAGFDRNHVTFVTAYEDRNTTFRKTISTLAWGSFAWFASEPDQLIVLSEQGQQNVRHLHTWLG